MTYYSQSRLEGEFSLVYLFIFCATYGDWAALVGKRDDR